MTSRRGRWAPTRNPTAGEENGTEKETRRDHRKIREGWPATNDAVSLPYGKEHDAERIARILELGKIHGERHEVFSVDSVANTFEEMNFRCVDQIEECARKIIRLGGGVMRKPGFARIALFPVDGRGPRWEYPPTFLMHHPAGLWMARIAHRLEERVPRATWASDLNDGKLQQK